MLAIGCDHGGYMLKKELIKFMQENDIQYKDFGCYSEESVDYPDVAADVARAVARGEFERGVLICGTGIGASIAANKIRGIRAALCENPVSARLSREHNDANVLCLGGRITGPLLAAEILTAYLGGAFQGGRHQRRVLKISELEKAD